MSRFAKGWIPNTRPSRFAFAEHAAAGSTSTPSSVDLSAHCPLVMDQGPTSSCTGHANAAACFTSFSAAGKPLPFVPSPKGLYTVGRAISRAGAAVPLTDDGAMPADVVAGAEQWGVRPMQAPTSDGRNSDCEPATVNDEPTLSELETDALKMPIGEHGITATGASRTLQIRQALAAGFAVTIGVQVDNAFENYVTNSSPVSAPDPTNLLGGHDLYLYGYRTEADGSTVWLGQNSWGATTGWGKGGRFEADESWTNDPNAGDLTAYIPTLESP